MNFDDVWNQTNLKILALDLICWVSLCSGWLNGERSKRSDITGNAYICWKCHLTLSKNVNQIIEAFCFFCVIYTGISNIVQLYIDNEKQFKSSLDTLNHLLKYELLCMRLAFYSFVILFPWLRKWLIYFNFMTSKTPNFFLIHYFLIVIRIKMIVCGHIFISFLENFRNTTSKGKWFLE